MPGDFLERIDELEHTVGHGILRGELEVDQIYAHYQHEGLEFKHPRGGQAKYLEEPLLAGVEGHMRHLEKTLLDVEGPRLGMQEIVEDLSRDVFDKAPREFDDLRNSGHPKVTDDHRVVYDRPPLVPRLTEEELREKNRLRRAGHSRYPLDHPQHVTNRSRG